MAHSVSSTKRIRQNLTHNEHNREIRSALRTQLKKVLLAISAGDPAKAKEELRLATKRLDKAAKTHVIHRNSAARQKSRLTRKVNSLGKAAKKA